MDTDPILYQLSREKVEQMDLRHLLSLYAPSRLPKGLALKFLLGRMLFCVEGYDSDPQEVYSIDEVCRFYRALHRAWPYWFYFCDLRQDGLKAMVCCCLQSFTALKVDGQATCAIEFDPFELIQFIAHDLPYLNGLCERADMTEQEILRRTKEVFTYFQVAV